MTVVENEWIRIEHHPGNVVRISVVGVPPFSLGREGVEAFMRAFEAWRRLTEKDR